MSSCDTSPSMPLTCMSACRRIWGLSVRFVIFIMRRRSNSLHGYCVDFNKCIKSHDMVCRFRWLERMRLAERPWTAGTINSQTRQNAQGSRMSAGKHTLHFQKQNYCGPSWVGDFSSFSSSSICVLEGAYQMRTQKNIGRVLKFISPYNSAKPEFDLQW